MTREWRHDIYITAAITLGICTTIALAIAAYLGHLGC